MAQRKFAQFRGRRQNVIAQACRVEQLEARRLLATVAGAIFNDVNGNGVRDAGEPGLSGWEVFLDKNGDLSWNAGAGETRVRADADGNFIMGGVGVGSTNKLVGITRVGYFDPAAATGVQLTVADVGDALTGQNVAMRQSVVGGRIFADYNQDGARQSDEPGIGGVAISVGTVNTVSSGTGIWGVSSDDLADGVYLAIQGTMSGFEFTNPATGVRAVEVSAANPISVYDVGNVPLGTISGTVVNDVNDNTVRDIGEPGLSGWTVYVDYNGDTVVDAGEQSAVTAPDGTYTLTGIRPGSYFVRAVPQANFKLRPAAVVATVTGTTNAMGIDFVPSQKARITGHLWYDLNADGVQDAGEPPQVGWGVYLDANNNGAFDSGEARQITDADGKYLFTNLTPGAYKVRTQIPINWSDQPINRATNLYSPNTTGGSVITDKDFGYAPAASVAGAVFSDTNADGVQDAGEGGLSGVRVFADANSNGTYDVGERSTLTDAGGGYTLWGLPAGSYTIDFTPPAGSTSSAGTPANFAEVLLAGQAVTGRNFGVSGAITGEIAGQVYDDANANGSKDGGENGVSSVRIFIDANNNGNYDGGESTALTDGSGNYTISGLAAGSQRLAFVLPSNYDLTGSTQLTQLVTVTGGATLTKNFSIQAAASGTAQIGGFIFQDVDADGVPEPGTGDVALPGRQAFIDRNANGTYEAGTDTVATADNTGTFYFTGLAAGTYKLYPILNAGETLSYGTAFYSKTVTDGEHAGGADWGIVIPGAANAQIGGFIFQDVNVSGTAEIPPDVALPGRQAFIDMNNNGTYQAGTDTVATADNTGTFNFTGLAAGPYKLYPILNAGETISYGSAFYSKTVTDGEHTGGADWGLNIPPVADASIAGFAYSDTDLSGTFNAGDGLITGRQVFIDVNTNGVYNAGTDIATTTDGTGTYQFTGLSSGTYRVYLTLNTGEVQTGSTPAYHTVVLASHQTVSGYDFSIIDERGSITGVFYDDNDASDSNTAGDGLLNGWRAFIDTNANGTYEAGTDVEALSGADGRYLFSGLFPATYKVYQELQGAATTNAATPPFYTIILTTGENRSGIDFGDLVP